MKCVVLSPQGHQQFNNSVAIRKSQGNWGQRLARESPTLLAAREGEGKRTLQHIKCLVLRAGWKL